MTVRKRSGVTMVYKWESRVKVRSNMNRRKFIRTATTALAGIFCGGAVEGMDNGTYNHAWSGGALTLLCQYAAGIAPTKPGFEEFAVLPQMGPLKRIRVVVPTKYGNIRLKLNKKTTLSIDLTVPRGTEAIIGVPKEINPADIRLNDKLVYKSGKAPTGRYVGEDDK